MNVRKYIMKKLAIIMSLVVSSPVTLAATNDMVEEYGITISQNYNVVDHLIDSSKKIVAIEDVSDDEDMFNQTKQVVVEFKSKDKNVTLQSQELVDCSKQNRIVIMLNAIDHKSKVIHAYTNENQRGDSIHDKQIIKTVCGSMMYQPL